MSHFEKNYMKNMLQQPQQQPQSQQQQQQQQQQQSQQQPHHHHRHHHHNQHHHHNHHNNQKQQTQPQISKLMDPQQMHVCRLCDKILSSSSSLDRHMLTHSGERPFVCKRCHMTFTTNGNMHRHMRTHLHKDSLARQQAEQQQLKSLGLIGGTSLSTTSPISSNATITCPTSINTLSSATIAATGSGAQEASTALAASAAAQLNQQLVAAFKQHLLTVVQSKQNNLDYDDEDDADDGDLDDDGNDGDHERVQANDDDGDLDDDCMLQMHDGHEEHEFKREQEREGERKRERGSGCQSGSRSGEGGNDHDHDNDNVDQEEDRTMDNNDESTIDVTVKLEPNRTNSSITSDDEDNDYEDEEEEGGREREDGDGGAGGDGDGDGDVDVDEDEDEDEEDRTMDNNDGSTIEVNEIEDLNIINTSITSEDDTSLIESDINNSLQMPLTPFASSLASTTTAATMNEKNNNININNNNNNNNNNNINYNNDQQLNVEAEQQITNFNQHNQLKQHLQQQTDLQTTFPNDSSLNSNGSHEIIEDISQSYVKTANPNAARKGGKRNRHCYKCKLCTYSSVDRCTLVRHLRIHSGERPYICGICRYAFTTKANCERHVRKRHKKQYNSLGGAGGGGVKGSNGGGRSLIITDHSNHQTIPVKVNPVAAQTISQTLQRIQEKQQQSDNAPILANANNSTTTTADDDLDLGRISNNNNHHQQISSNHLDSRIDINNNSNNNIIINEATSQIAYNKSKRKHRPGETNVEHAVSYQRRRLVDKHDDIFSTSRLSTGRKQAQHHLDAIQRQHQNNSNLLFNPQSSSFAPNLTASAGPDIPPTNELFVNLVTQLQQVITNSQQQQQQIEHNNNSNNNNSNIDTPQALRLPIASPVPATNVSSATFLANMLAAGKIIGNATMVAPNDGQLSPGQSATTSSLSPKHLSLQFASQLRNLNSQAPFFIGRNPFNPLDLAAQALDLSCKFQSSK